MQTCKMILWKQHNQHTPIHQYKGRKCFWLSWQVKYNLLAFLFSCPWGGDGVRALQSTMQRERQLENYTASTGRRRWAKFTDHATCTDIQINRVCLIQRSFLRKQQTIITDLLHVRPFPYLRFQKFVRQKSEKHYNDLQLEIFLTHITSMSMATTGSSLLWLRIFFLIKLEWMNEKTKYSDNN